MLNDFSLKNMIYNIKEYELNSKHNFETGSVPDSGYMKFAL